MVMLAGRSDLTLHALLSELRERGVVVSCDTLWRFLRKGHFDAVPVMQPSARPIARVTGRRPPSAPIGIKVPISGHNSTKGIIVPEVSRLIRRRDRTRSPFEMSTVVRQNGVSVLFLMRWML